MERAGDSSPGRLTRRRVLAGAGAGLLSAPALAQAPDAAPLRIIVPFPPGGSYDQVARIVLPGLSARLRRSVVIENRGGAGGNIGAEAVARSAPDGNTVLLWGDGLLSNAALYRRLSWDPLKDFAPVALFSASPVVIVGRPGAPSLREMIEGKASGRRFTYGTAGNGSPGHIAGALLASRGGLNLEHVPYRGGGPVLTDLMAGQIDLASNPLPPTLPFLQSGQMVAIGVAGERRAPLLPDAPAIGEVLPGFAVNTWYGVLAPAHTPAAPVAALARALREAATDPAITATLTAQGFEQREMGPDELAAFMAREAPRWREMVALSGAVVE